MTNINLGFITNNAGEDIPGSTIKHTISNFYQYFDKVIVVDGNLTREAANWYSSIPNIKVIDNKWTGRHVDQYIARNKACNQGDWILALDCDEAPSIELAYNIKELIRISELKNFNILGLQSKDFYCKHNSNAFYPINKERKIPEGISKTILYKVEPSLTFITNKTGTHVTPTHNIHSRLALCPFFYHHYKSPETMTFNAAICIMDDLFPIGEDLDSGPMGLTKLEREELYAIGNKYDILGKEKFRRATKHKAWPISLENYVKRFKHRKGLCRSLYTLYYVFLGAAKDVDPLSYEEACEIADFNENYKINEKLMSPLIIEHTNVLLDNIDLPCGAG